VTTTGRICTVHKWWLAALLLTVATGCNQPGRYQPVVTQERGGVYSFDTHTGTMHPTPRTEPPKR
jgi:hypothetical protein